MDFKTILKDDKYILPLKRAVVLLEALGYCESLICKRLELSNISDISWRFIPIYRKEQLANRDALDCAIDLFLLQGALCITELEKMFDTPTAKNLINSGILSLDKETVVSNLSCYPIKNTLIFSDHAWPKLPHPGLKEISYEQVMYIGLDSRWLALSTPRRRFDSALDLCTGSGIHALLAAKHTKHVVAVDINQRAAECTNLNSLALNLSNIRVCVGDLYENIDGKFDLITANPPFVPSPADTLGYRDGGNNGERVQRKIVKGLASYLAKDGIAQIITEIGEAENESLLDKVRLWLGDTPMDIFILRFQSLSAASYAMSHANIDDSYKAYFDDIDRWTSNMRAQGYQKISSVLLTFKWSKNSAKPWGRIEDADMPSRDIGSQIEELFEIENLLQRDDIFELLKQTTLTRVSKIGLLEAREIGASLTDTKAHAKLLDASLSFAKWLSQEEVNILQAFDQPMTLSTLATKLSSSQEILFEKVCGLIRSGFLR